MSAKKLILVDGTAALYRAYFAIRGLSTHAGQPTNAVFGFIRMLRQLRAVWQPTHWAVVFDGGTPAARRELLVEYKAQRPPMPDGLRDQVPLSEEYLELSGVAWVRREGQEADDVLASIAAWAEPGAGEILVATGDKDLMQLVGGKLSLVALTGKADATDSEGVRLKTGVAPHQVVEWLALVGDSSDNIPGVPGVGPKTAARLLTEYGSLDAVWSRLGELPSDKLRQALAGARELVRRNVALIRLRRDIENELGWDELVVRDPDAGKLLRYFERLEFKSLAQELREPGLFGD